LPDRRIRPEGPDDAAAVAALNRAAFGGEDEPELIERLRDLAARLFDSGAP
jgi:predicted N-acetyltransferase YhbS